MRHHFKHRAAMIAALAASVVGGTAAASDAAHYAHHGGPHGQLQVGQQGRQQQLTQQQRSLQQRSLQQRSLQQRGSQLQRAQVSDGAIAGVISESHKFEIAQAMIARKLARTQEVKDFAQAMISSHSQANRRLSALLTRLRIKMEPTRVSSMIRGHSSLVSTYLSQQSATEFDRAFMDSQVKMHRFSLRILDEQLIPKVRNKELKEELQRVRAEVVSHLDHALAIQAKLVQGQAPSQGR